MLRILKQGIGAGRSGVGLLFMVLPALALAAPAAEDFAAIVPLFRQHCVVCHSGTDAVLGLRLDSYEGVLAGSSRGPVVRPGNAAGSELIRRLRGESLPRMPLTGPPFLAEPQIARVAAWIAAGAPRGSGEAAAGPKVPSVPRVLPRPGENVRYSHVAPIFLQRCAKCHSQQGILGAPPEGLRLVSLAETLHGGERVVVVPGQPLASELYRRVSGLAQPRMPFDGPPYLAAEEIRVIGDWIAQGARDAEGRPAPVPVGAPVRLSGALTDRWAVDGQALRVDAATRIDKAPRVGDRVEVRGVIDSDGGVRVQRLRRR